MKVVQSKPVQSQRGIGLLELMLSLAIIAILLVMATRYFGAARRSQQTAAAITVVQAIMAAASNYALANNNSTSKITGMSGLINSGYLPESTSPNGPWGGPITVAAGGVSGYPASVKVGIPNVPDAASCAALVNAVTGLATPTTTPTCSAGTGLSAVVGG